MFLSLNSFTTIYNHSKQTHTSSHSHSADSAFSLQVHANLKGHIDISLVLAHCLPAHLTNHTSTCLHRFREHWPLIQICLHTQAHSHIPHPTYSGIALLLYLYISVHLKSYSLRFTCSPVQLTLLFLACTTTKNSLLQINL